MNSRFVCKLQTWCLVTFSLLLFYNILSAEAYKFIEYPYKETKRNEIIFREFEIACQQSNGCSARKGLDNVQCVRECISPTCYSIIYKNDELEQGEIDVRLSSFKGCFVQRSRTRTY